MANKLTHYIAVAVLAIAIVTITMVIEGPPPGPETPEAAEIRAEGTIRAAEWFSYAVETFVEDGDALSTPDTDGFDRAVMGEPLPGYRLVEPFTSDKTVWEQSEPQEFFWVPIVVDDVIRAEYSVHTSKDGEWSFGAGGGFVRGVDKRASDISKVLGTRNYRVMKLIAPSANHGGQWIVASAKGHEVGFEYYYYDGIAPLLKDDALVEAISQQVKEAEEQRKNGGPTEWGGNGEIPTGGGDHVGTPFGTTSEGSHPDDVSWDDSCTNCHTWSSSSSTLRASEQIDVQTVDEARSSIDFEIVVPLVTDVGSPETIRVCAEEADPSYPCATFFWGPQDDSTLALWVHLSGAPRVAADRISSQIRLVRPERMKVMVGEFAGFAAESYMLGTWQVPAVVIWDRNAVVHKLEGRGGQTVEELLQIARSAS